MFNQELTLIGPRLNLILFDPLHCYKKFIHAVGDHHWPRKNIRLVRTIVLWNKRRGWKGGGGCALWHLGRQLHQTEKFAKVLKKNFQLYIHMPYIL